jgi:hypothetical protein
MSSNSFDRISQGLAAKSSRRQAFKLLGGGIAAGALGSVGLSQVATAQRPPVGALELVATATNELGETTTGTFTLTNFVNQGGELLAVGNLDIPGLFEDIVSTLVTVSQASCEILDLDLGPINLDLLGLVVDISPIAIDINAEPGAGNLLGNLLCAVTNLLNGGGPLGALAGLLNRILGILG